MNSPDDSGYRLEFDPSTFRHIDQLGIARG